MTKLEKYIIDNFNKLYNNEEPIEGLLLGDPCDYDDEGKPTWLVLYTDRITIEADYKYGIYTVLIGYEGWLGRKRYKTLRGAINFCKRNS